MKKITPAIKRQRQFRRVTVSTGHYDPRGGYWLSGQKVVTQRVTPLSRFIDLSVLIGALLATFLLTCHTINLWSLPTAEREQEQAAMRARYEPVVESVLSNTVYNPIYHEASAAVVDGLLIRATTVFNERNTELRRRIAEGEERPPFWFLGGFTQKIITKRNEFLEWLTAEGR